MTQDEIIEIAGQAGMEKGIVAFNIVVFEAFAKLVAAKGREWVGLTEAERAAVVRLSFGTERGLAIDIEAKLKEKNT